MVFETNSKMLLEDLLFSQCRNSRILGENKRKSNDQIAWGVGGREVEKELEGER